MERKCYDLYFETPRTPVGERGKQVTSGWWFDNLDDAKRTAQGILIGLCTVGGHKHGKVGIYEGDTIRARISMNML